MSDPTQGSAPPGARVTDVDTGGPGEASAGDRDTTGPPPDDPVAREAIPGETTRPASGVRRAAGLTRRTQLGLVVAVLFGFLLGAAALWAVDTLRGSGGAAGGGGTASSSPGASQGPSPAPTEDAGASLERGASYGRADAPITIELWADFQCPYCGLSARAVVPSMIRELGDTGLALIRFRDFAFLGAESMDAAVAARCAAAQGRYLRYHDVLYASQQGENQGAFRPEVLTALAKFVGLDQTAFAACQKDPRQTIAVQAETEEGTSLGVNSTPTIRVIGPGGVKVITSVAPMAEIEAAMDAVRTPATSAPPGASPSAGPSAAPSP